MRGGPGLGGMGRGDLAADTGYMNPRLIHRGNLEESDSLFFLFVDNTNDADSNEMSCYVGTGGGQEHYPVGRSCSALGSQKPPWNLEAQLKGQLTPLPQLPAVRLREGTPESRYPLVLCKMEA